MAKLISEEKPKEILKNYFTLLRKAGYVKHPVVFRMLAYLFLLDFISSVSNFIDEKDYLIINRVMKQLFSSGDCLLPYPVYCINRATLGESTLMTGNFRFRSPETDTSILRTSEDDLYRIIEDGTQI